MSGLSDRVDWTAGWANWTPQNTAYPATTDVIAAGDITTNTTLVSSKVYLLDGWVYVKSGATLTIEPGTVIRGSKANKGALIIEKGAKIMAEGTSAKSDRFHLQPGCRFTGHTATGVVSSFWAMPP